MKKYLKPFLICKSLILFLLSANSQIVINEFMAKNDSSFADSQNNYYDWIELYNTSDSIVSLLNFSITDEVTNLRKYEFGNVSIPPKSYLMLYASGEEVVKNEDIYLGFKISNNGESLILSNGDSTIIDSIAPVFLGDNISFGRLSDGQNIFGYFLHGTPNGSNSGLEVMKYHEILNFSHSPGFYSSPVNLSINTMEQAADIFYSLDGSIPDTNSLKYSDAIQLINRSTESNIISEIITWPEWSPWPHPNLTTKIDKGNVLRIQAFLNGKKAGNLYTHSYFVFPSGRTTYSLPIISVVTDSNNLFNADSGIYVPGNSYSNGFTGNYSNRGKEWERAANVECIDESNSVVINQQVGIRVEGATSQIIPNKSLRIYARDSYGKETIEQPLFSEDITEFKKLLLRPAGQDFHLSYLRDILAHELAKRMQLDYQAFKPVILFMNGEYWGINYLREFQDENYLESHYNENKNEFILEEESAEFQTFIDYVTNNDLTTNSIYSEVVNQLDIDSYINYTLHEMFTGRWDYMNRCPWKHEEGKWRFFTSDYDASFEGPCAITYSVEQDMVDYLLGSNSPCWSTSFPCNNIMCYPLNSNILIRKLISNDTFKERFIDLADYHLKHTFRRDTISAILNSIQSSLEPEINKHIERWNAPENLSSWKEEINSVNNYCSLRNCILRTHIKNYFSLETVEFEDAACSTSSIKPKTNTEESIRIYPNPSNGNIFITISDDDDYNLNIEVLNLSGQLVYSCEVSSGDNLIELNTLETGTYLIHINGQKTCLTKKLSIVR